MTLTEYSTDNDLKKEAVNISKHLSARLNRELVYQLSSPNFILHCTIKRFS